MNKKYKDPFGGVHGEAYANSPSPFKIDKEEALREIIDSLEKWDKKKIEKKSFLQKLRKGKSTENEATKAVHWNYSKESKDYVNVHLVWSKKNSAPFNSQIKIYKDRFFIIDFTNTLRCFSIKDGTELWNFQTESSLIRSQKKLSIVIIRDVVYFNNSFGDITGLNTKNGYLLWQTPTQNTSIIEDAFNLKTSDIVADQKSIIFSNNKNEFYSLNLKTGRLNWKQKVNSNVRPTIINNLIFSVSNEGFLFILDAQSGNIIRITDIFQSFKDKKRKKISPQGFIVGKEKIYLTTSNGRLLIIDITTGKTVSMIKIDNEKISRPFVSNKNLFIIKENSIIKLN